MQADPLNVLQLLLLLAAVLLSIPALLRTHQQLAAFDSGKV